VDAALRGKLQESGLRRLTLALALMGAPLGGSMGLVAGCSGVMWRRNAARIHSGTLAIVFGCSTRSPVAGHQMMYPPHPRVSMWRQILPLYSPLSGSA